MTQVPTKTAPTRAHCRALLRSMPALAAFKRTLHADAPPESRGWLGALGVVVRHDEGLRPSKVAEMLHVDLSVASRALTQLEELGYVRREPDPDDGRATRAHATDAGRTWIDGVADRFAERVQDYLADWDDADVVTLTTLLDRFGTTLENRR